MSSIVLPTHSRECTYVALATLLPCHLRLHASTAHLCYFQIVDHAPDAEQLFVRVAALPHRLNDLHSTRVFTLCLCRDQLAQALPWDRAMQARPTGDVRELVALHAQQLGGDTRSIPPVRTAAAPAPASDQHEEVKHTHVALPEVFVSCETVQEVVAHGQVPDESASLHKQGRWVTCVWLQAAIAMLRRQRSHLAQATGKLHTFLASLDQAMRCAFVAQHRSRHSLVCANPVFLEGRHVGWHLLVNLPVTPTLALAA